MSKTKFKAIEEITLPDSVKKAIEEQQARVWRLRNLIECVRKAADSSDDVEDFGAAITGLQDYADDTAMALDAGAIAQRAIAIEEQERQAAIRGAVEGGASAADVEDIPTRQ
jgi:hypothetical protein